MTDYKAVVERLRRPHLRNPDGSGNVFSDAADAVEALLGIEQRLTDHINQMAAERDEAVKQLAESRARFGDMEARVVELEAVVHAAKEWNTLTNGRPRYRDFDDLVSKAPSVVLADHDAAVWDQGAKTALVSEGYTVVDHAAVLQANPYRGENR